MTSAPKPGMRNFEALPIYTPPTRNRATPGSMEARKEDPESAELQGLSKLARRKLVIKKQVQQAAGGPAGRPRRHRNHGQRPRPHLCPKIMVGQAARRRGIKPQPPSWTTTRCWRSSSASSPRSAGASTKASPTSTPACPTARASTPSSPRSRSPAPASPSASFPRSPSPTADLIRMGRSRAAPSPSSWDACVKLRKNIIVSGGTGSGKTTLLNVLSSYLPGRRAHRHHRGRRRAAPDNQPT
jgi:hypothetical protein